MALAIDEIPSELVSHVTAGCGKRGVEWLEALPRMINCLEDLWQVAVGEPFAGIEYNFVAPAIKDNGEEVVIKIHPPWDPIEIFDEAAFLAKREGRGCVRLLAVNHDSRAIMLERILPGRTLTEIFAESKSDAVGPAIEALKSISIPASHTPPTAPTVDGWFGNFERYRETDFPRRYAEKAFEFYRELSPEPGRTLYIHGDFHPGNIVNAEREQFLVIDPKGVVGHIGFEIAAFLNNFYWWQENDPDIDRILADALEQFSSAFEIPQTELRKWAYAQMVIGAWWNYSDMPDLYDGGVVKADVWNV